MKEKNVAQEYLLIVFYVLIYLTERKIREETEGVGMYRKSRQKKGSVQI